MTSRRGTIYIMVLGITTLVMAVGLGAVVNARSKLDRQRDARRLLGADAAARAGLELAFAAVNTYASMPAAFSSGTLAYPTEFGDYALAIDIARADPADWGSLNRYKITVLAQGSGVRQYRSMIVEPMLDRQSSELAFRMIPGSYRMEIEKR